MSAALELGLVGAALLLLAAIAAQFYRGELSRDRLPMILGIDLVWLSYGLLELSQGGPIPTGTPLNYVADGAAVLALLGAVYALSRWYRERD